MKKAKKVILGFICILIVTIVFVGFWQRNNVVVVVDSFAYSGEELTDKIDQNKKELEESLAEYAPGIGRDFTQEEEEQIRTGELSPQEAVEKLLKEGQPQESPVAQAEQTNENSKAIDQVIGDHVTQMYSLKAQYIRELGLIKSQIISEYNSLPKDQRNLTGKQKLAKKYIDRAASFEKLCDSQVEEILSSLGDKLIELGGDTTIIKIIRDAYVNEKSLRKAYYLNLLIE